MGLPGFKESDPKRLEYFLQRDDGIREAAKQGDSVSDLAETYELPEDTVRAIIAGKKKKPKTRLSISKCPPKRLERVYMKVTDMRLRGFNTVYISSVLRINHEDIKALIEEFNIPCGIRCADCDKQVILAKISSRALCSECNKIRERDRRCRRARERYKTDPVFRKKQIMATQASKQAKILG